MRASDRKAASDRELGAVAVMGALDIGADLKCSIKAAEIIGQIEIEIDAGITLQPRKKPLIQKVWRGA